MLQKKAVDCRALNRALEQNYRRQTQLAYQASEARSRLMVLRGELSILIQKRDVAETAVQIAGPSPKKPSLGNTVFGAMTLAVAVAALREAEMKVERARNEIAFQEDAVDSLQDAEIQISERIELTLQELQEGNC